VASLQKSALFRLRWLLLGPIPVGWCIIAHMGLLNVRQMEEKVIDWRFRFRGPIQAPVKVVYVDVDSISLLPPELGGIGGWPWSRNYFATVSQALIDNAGVKAIGMDFVFSDEGVAESIDHSKLVAGDRELGRFLLEHPNVVVAASYAAGDFRDNNGKQKIREFPDITRPDLPPIHQIEPPERPALNISIKRKVAPPEVAVIDTVDGGTRWVWMFAPTAAGTFNTMALELARIYYGVERDGVKIEANHIDLVRPDGSLATRIPLTRHQMVEINWFSPWISAAQNPRVSFSNVYVYSQLLKSEDPAERKSAQEFFAQDEFKDAVVLIGPTDNLLLHDVSTTSFDEKPVARVGVHGNLLKTIVSGRYMRRLPEFGAYALICGLAAVVSALAVVGGGRAVFAKVMAVLAAGIYVALAFELFKTSSLIIPVVAPLGAAFTTSFVSLIWQIVEEQKQKGRIKGMFSTYLAPALVNQMVESGEEPKLGGVVEHITAYFSDIENFSSMSEQLSPQLLVELMNEYLSACTDILQAEGGTLDKYIGDAVIMIFGAPVALPGHPHKACIGALRVQRRIGELRQKWTGEGDKWPTLIHRLQARVGLNTGPAVVGNMGSRTRFSYTMMSDDVNIAARMESGAKAWGVYTMCTDATKAGCEDVEPGRVLFRALGRIVVKGRAQPVPIFELVALREETTDAMRECVSLFEQGLARYGARDFSGAIGLFLRSEPLEVNGPGRTTGAKINPSSVYIGIARSCLADPPPADWDGVYHMKEK
jgi:adenylate cyclase